MSKTKPWPLLWVFIVGKDLQAKNPQVLTEIPEDVKDLIRNHGTFLMYRKGRKQRTFDFWKPICAHYQIDLMKDE